MHHAERGLFELRRGRIVCVTGAGAEASLVAAVEGLTEDTLKTLRELSSATLRLVVTPHRAAAMGITPAVEGYGDRANGRPRHLSLHLPASAPLTRILRISSAADNHLAEDIDLRTAAALESAGLDLVRLGRLLPAIVTVPVRPSTSFLVTKLLEESTILRVPADQIEALYAAHTQVDFISEANVPLQRAENARFLLFREGNGLFEHLAVVVGDPGPEAPFPVRLHSACVTGDLFGSLRCDCGQQLRGSMRHFVQNGSGALLYLAHEGRSIGLANKLRAYTMQENGLDTLDADCALGFGPDERRYDAAVQILRHLGVDHIRLLTNNPEKLRAMERGGIRVAGRDALHGTLTAHNLPYLSAKAQRAGHWMEGMLSQRLPKR